jgi:K(+)-stimulated pyrophosphate-energized sodium pump
MSLAFQLLAQAAGKASGFGVSPEQVKLPPFSHLTFILLYMGLAVAFISIFFGIWLASSVMKASPGSKKMQDVADGIREGAMAYLARQRNTMIPFVLVIAACLFFFYHQMPAYAHHISLQIGIALAFLLGVTCSYIAGYVGMGLAVRANVRTANAALSSFKKALEVSFLGGGVSGMFTIGMGLLGATAIFLVFKEKAMFVLVGFGFGGSLAALFMRMGGGIYTKAADVGSDLVGKVEKNIPEDDPRNAATIADNVGDNVGDCAGMAADVFESYEVTLVAAIILGAALYHKFGVALIIFPILVRAIGVIASYIGIKMVKGTEEMTDPMKPINVGFWVSAIASFIGLSVVGYYYLGVHGGHADWWKFVAACGAGLVLAILTLYLTNYYTHIDAPAVTETAYSTKTGVATMILSGLAFGLQSSVWAILLICATIGASLYIFKGDIGLQMYGVALAGLGLLTTTGYILAMDTYGPVTDNANGIFEMSGALKESENGERAHQIVAKLDAIGNTTKALTKGLAIATAVIAATSLFSSFIEAAGLSHTGIRLELPEVFVGLLIGGSVPFLFSGFAISAVGRAAFLVVEEVRRQFREIPGIMEWKAKPDYERCVDISTRAAQKELLGPGVLAICTPLLVGFALGAQALGGYLAGSILSGQLMAVFMSNAGAIWDNGKKKIEEGLFGGKGTEQHKAGVVGDTVGDPLKDTAGPAINPLIKVGNLVAILIAPAITALALPNMSPVLRIGVIVVCAGALAFSVWFSNRGSIVREEVYGTDGGSGMGGNSKGSVPAEPAGVK